MSKDAAVVLPDQIRQQVQKAVIEHAKDTSASAALVEKFEQSAPIQPQIYWTGFQHTFQFWRQTDGQILFSIYPTQQLFTFLLVITICGVAVAFFLKNKPGLSHRKKHQIRRIEL